MFAFRPAVAHDIDVICAFDPIAQHDRQRGSFVERSVGAGHCYVAEVRRLVFGYGVLDYSFFQQGFVSMLVIHPEHRRMGAGMELLRHLETMCRTPKLFTSTNLSNVPMQALLAKMGYVFSGVIQHLDEGDPELVFVKFLHHGHE